MVVNWPHVVHILVKKNVKVITENGLKGEVEIWVDGSLADEAEFTGSDTVRVKGPKK